MNGSLGFALVGGLALTGGALVSATQESGSRDQMVRTSTVSRSVWDGVYTREQAQRGSVEYGKSCEGCHLADLGGNPASEIPPLAWDGFMARWNGRTVRDLVDTIRRSMPADAPNSLNRRAYVDVVSYLLQANQFPSGAVELDRDSERLSEIRITRAAGTSTP
jgi:S-disulfanyl-L-cysteine oxidoreductase SoxD